MPLAVVPRPRVRVGVDVFAELNHSLVDKLYPEGQVWSRVTNAQIQGKT